MNNEFKFADPSYIEEKIKKAANTIDYVKRIFNVSGSIDRDITDLEATIISLNLLIEEGRKQGNMGDIENPKQAIDLIVEMDEQMASLGKSCRWRANNVEEDIDFARGKISQAKSEMSRVILEEEEIIDCAKCGVEIDYPIYNANSECHDCSAE